MRKYVVGFAFNNCDVLLIQKKRPTWMSGLYNGIGGLVEHGEAPSEAMMREFKEETSVQTTPWRLFCILTTKDDEGEYEVYFFTTRLNIVDFESCETQADEPLKQFSYHHLPRNCMVNLNYLIPMCMNSHNDNVEYYRVTEVSS